MLLPKRVKYRRRTPWKHERSMQKVVLKLPSANTVYKH